MLQIFTRERRFWRFSHFYPPVTPGYQITTTVAYSVDKVNSFNSFCKNILTLYVNTSYYLSISILVMLYKAIILC